MDDSTAGPGGTTYTSPADDPGPQGGDPPRNGVDTDNLRDYRAMRRSRADRKIAGVAGGLARHLDIDPLVVRVLLVVMVFFSGAGLLLYGALWLLVPDEDGSTVLHSEDNTRNALVDHRPGGRRDHRLLHGPGHRQRWRVVPVAAADRRAGVAPDPPAATPRRHRLTRRLLHRPAVPPPPPGTSAVAPTPSYPGPAGAPPPTWQPAPARPRRRRGPLLLWPTLALIAVALGTLGLVGRLRLRRARTPATPHWRWR